VKPNCHGYLNVIFLVFSALGTLGPIYIVSYQLKISFGRTYFGKFITFIALIDIMISISLLIWYISHEMLLINNQFAIAMQYIVDSLLWAGLFLGISLSCIILSIIKFRVACTNIYWKTISAASLLFRGLAIIAMQDFHDHWAFESILKWVNLVILLLVVSCKSCG
jgi:hypothetical protein